MSKAKPVVNGRKDQGIFPGFKEIMLEVFLWFAGFVACIIAIVPTATLILLLISVLPLLANLAIGGVLIILGVVLHLRSLEMKKRAIKWLLDWSGIIVSLAGCVLLYVALTFSKATN